jgi:GDP-4-dehydro-6-deoxy-D-mannose reductase
LRSGSLRGVRVWVSGARGFVGGWLLPRLARDGHAAVGADHDVDVRDAAAVDTAIAAAQPDAIVHLAALASVADSYGDPDAVARVNYLGTLHVLRAAARRAPQARVLLVSSGEVYGGADTETPIAESAPLAPASPYARSKAAADLLGAAHAAGGLDVVRARPWNHTGPGQSDAYVASSFARQLAEIAAGRREAVLRVGNLDAVRDFSDVADVADAYARLLDRAVPAGAYNVASGVAVRVGALLERLCEHAKLRPAIEVDPARHRAGRASVGDASRLRRATGWAPRLSLDDTLARLYDDWRRRLSATP